MTWGKESNVWWGKESNDNELQRFLFFFLFSRGPKKEVGEGKE